MQPSPATSLPQRFIAELRANWHTDRIPAWALLPLRLFLGITFVYAGLQKLTDPHFFHPGTPDYIGRQIIAFAAGSPLHNFLLHVAEPHAVLFGTLVAYSELAVGVGVLAGLLMRPAAVGGLVLSVLFFLTASWRVRPYFYGADIVFAFAWVPVILAGPAHGILPAVDTRLMLWLRAHVPAMRRARVARVLAVVLGVPLAIAPATVAASTPEIPVAGAGAKGKHAPARSSARHAPRQPVRTTARRDFLWGAAAGAAGMLSLTWLWNLLNPAPVTPSAGSGAGGTTNPGSAATAGTTGATGTTETIAQVSAVPVNSAATFTLQTNGDPGVLVHLTSGKFVAFDATCTHQGCPVQYDPGSKLLLCPCHGAAFDPSQNAAVVQGPAYQPLTPVTINVNQQSGAITTQD